MDKYSYAVFGNPISHSKSPIIHNIFSMITKIKHNYIAQLVSKNDFFNVLESFFKSNGKGANITLPFKIDAFSFSDLVTKHAQISKSVNTLKKLKSGKILGDNTDGIGLIYDLKRIKFIRNNTKKKILLLGAGGASRNIIFPLLSLGHSIYILNRTIEKSNQLVLEFSKYGDIILLNSDNISNIIFDVVINATSAGMQGLKPICPKNLITPKTFCYDMCYEDGITPFLSWCSKNGALRICDGFGMLVAQAAYSFYLWHNILPEINLVINLLKKNSFI